MSGRSVGARRVGCLRAPPLRPGVTPRELAASYFPSTHAAHVPLATILPAVGLLQGAAIDVGVWMGYHSVALAKLAAPHRVLSIEANAWAVERARENLRLNNARNVEVVHASEFSTCSFLFGRRAQLHPQQSVLSVCARVGGGM
jgi:hypothetical protein